MVCLLAKDNKAKEHIREKGEIEGIKEQSRWQLPNSEYRWQE